ncbi:hypothetical protein GYMLUDRAFT_253339 [Collybiopsis luxurians FD-317 M1]|uniref:F-box domain-containing protein n=1 Tax=Collybiopsis luxurians FD-317 M1 TaxID=944289 RepID=A0A0D0B7K2_9AGAR|nr:hypothetical protein GYMLUDRAFT_253339 [Collybiopsis luxurians FD-317 M1]
MSSPSYNATFLSDQQEQSTMLLDDSVTVTVLHSEMPPQLTINPGKNERQTLAHLFNLLSNGDLMRLRRVCRGMRILVDAFVTQKLNIETSLIVYFGTAARARRFREHQQRLGAVLSGAWSYLFLSGASHLAPSLCPLDIYVDHSSVPAVANILRPMGFQYCSTRWELVHDHRLKFQATFEENRGRTNGTSEGSFVYCFTNRNVLARVFGATHGILNAIFEQESTMTHNLVSASDAWSVFPSSTFDRLEPTPIITHKTFNFITGGYRGSLGLDISQFSSAPGKEFLLGPHQFGDTSMWRYRLAPPISNNKDDSTALLLLHGWSVIYAAARFQILYRITDCGFLNCEYCMPRFLNIIIESYRTVSEE